MRQWLLALTVVLTAIAPHASAAEGAAAEEPRAAPEQAVPHRHFEEALEHYRNGRYRQAIAELQAALALDPAGKDLVYNLALVHEKLGELDLAVAALRRYLELEVDPAEVKRAEQAIARMEGARVELEAEQRPPAPPPPAVPSSPSPLPDRQRERVDGWILGGTGLAAAAALVGIVFGVRALALKPDAGSTSRDAEDRRRQRRAEESAIIADIGLSVGVLAGAGTAFLWFSRAPRDAHGAPGELGLSYGGRF